MADAQLRQVPASREHGVEVQQWLAHPHEDGVVGAAPSPGLHALEPQHLIEDLRRLRLRPKRICPVAQKVQVRGHPDCEDRHTELRPSR